MEVSEGLKNGMKVGEELKSLSFVLKVILVVWGDVYGIVRRVTSGKTVPVIVGVVQFLTGNLFGLIWLVDLIMMITKKEIPLAD
ncbi:MAG: hypothetical protein HDR36_07590 [Treponema sp.]|nr:hypothetical protein [Treponema sp.]MBD5436354.1 hypothetical protein [Treponema sp.]MBD5439097.1 hypothetical protein [Treponema sp.]MBD5439665.1 hypothetical protein [Treponema sp.]